MDRLLANGTVNAAQFGNGQPLFLLHSLLSDRASFDAIVPRLSQSFRVIVPELPGFGQSRAVSGGLADVADRMAEAVTDAAGKDEAIVLGNGYGGFVALQMAIRHPKIATKLILADCGAAFSANGREAFRNMAAASSARGLAAITDVAMRWPSLTCGPGLRGSRSPFWCWLANMTRRRRRRCRTNWLPACRTHVSRLLPAARTSRNCNRPKCFWMRSAISCRRRPARRPEWRPASRA